MRACPFPKYKLGKASWLPEIPEDWDQKRGRFVMAVNPAPTQAQKLSPSDEVSFVPMEAIGEGGGIDLSRTRTLDEISAGYTAFEEGDVVIAKGSVN